MKKLSIVSIIFSLISLFSHVYAFAAQDDPTWLKKLSATQLKVFNQCKSVYEIRKSPYDYNATDAMTLQRKKLVEGAHFTASVKSGIAGNTGAIEDDLNYVLNQFPNHHAALWVMGRLQMSNNFRPFKVGRTDYAFPSFDCYIKRALEFKPHDTTTYLVAAIVKHKQKKYVEAERYYQFVLKNDPDNYEAHYNVGLMYVDIGKNELALKHAHKAYEGQYPLKGLKNKLQKSGAWKSADTKS